MPVLIGGFTLQTGVSIDDRYIISKSSERFDFSSGLLYEGLTTYSTGSQEYFIFVSASKYGTAESASSWKKVITAEAGTNNVNITGQLSLPDLPDVSASIATLNNTEPVAQDLQDITSNGPFTNKVITSSNGIVTPTIIPYEGDGTAGGSFGANGGRFKFNPSDFRIGSRDLSVLADPVTKGLAISGGYTPVDNISNSPRFTVLEHDYLSFSSKKSGLLKRNFAYFDLSSADTNLFLITGSISASKGVGARTAFFTNEVKSPKYIISSSDSSNINITSHQVSSDHFLVLSGSGVKLESLPAFPAVTVGAFIVKGGVAYLGVD